MSHTPENWDKEPCEAQRHGGFYLVDSDGNGIGHIYAKFGAGEHNARRIVACINACEGIPIEWLESNGSYDGWMTAKRSMKPIELPRSNWNPVLMGHFYSHGEVVKAITAAGYSYRVKE